MRIIFNKWFNREYGKAHIPKAKFNKAVKELIEGRSDSLGHRLFKKRIGSISGGRSGGYRGIAYVRIGEFIIFIYLFQKNELDNISKKQLKELIIYSKSLDRLDMKRIEALIKAKEMFEYDYEEPKD